MSVSPYAVTTEAFKKHGQDVNPHPQYALAADVAKQLSAKAHVSHTHPSSPIIVAASPGAVTVHIHTIGDVTGLQAALNSKAAVSHGHSISDVTSLQDALDAKAAISHGHPQSDVTNLVSDLAGKAASVHTHAQSDVTGLVAALAAKVPTSRIVGGQDSINIASGTDLSADVFLNLAGDDDTPGNNKVYGTDASGVKGWKNDPGGAPPDTSYSPGSFTVVTETAKILSRRLKLTGTQRATLAGTAALRIT